MASPTTLIMSERFRRHDTGDHPENPRRLDAIERHLASVGLLEGRPVVAPRPASPDDVALCHDERYVRLIESVCASGGGWLDGDTYACAESYETALLAAGAAIQAVDLVLDGEARRVFVFARPPGHHAERSQAMGFCLFNNVAIAAAHAVDRRDLRRVAIVDWDVHHGNGTQDLFYDDDRVLYASVHQWPLYPGSGRADQIGSGHGEGCTVNVPLRPGSGDEAYLRAFDEVIGPRVLAFAPELILVSAGFDAHVDDPLADMAVTEEGYAAMARRVRAWAEACCDGRLVLLLEGGYNLRALAASVEATLRALDSPDQPREPST